MRSVCAEYTRTRGEGGGTCTVAVTPRDSERGGARENKGVYVSCHTYRASTMVRFAKESRPVTRHARFTFWDQRQASKHLSTKSKRRWRKLHDNRFSSSSYLGAVDVRPTSHDKQTQAKQNRQTNKPKKGRLARFPREPNSAKCIYPAASAPEKQQATCTCTRHSRCGIYVPCRWC